MPSNKRLARVGAKILRMFFIESAFKMQNPRRNSELFVNMPTLSPKTQMNVVNWYLFKRDSTFHTLTMVLRLILFLFLLPATLMGQGISERLSVLEAELAALKSKQQGVEKQIEGVKLEECQVEIKAKGLPKLADGEELVMHEAMALVYSEEHEQAKWVAHVILQDITTGKVGRSNDFRVDPMVGTGTAVEADYFLKKEEADGTTTYDGFGFDRGHLAPSADFRWSQIALSESYFYSNMSPQRADFNRGIWADLEANLRAYVSRNKDSRLFVVTGPILEPGLPKVDRSLNGVSVPKRYFKVAVDVHLGRGIGFLLPNEGTDRPLTAFAVPIDEVESATGLDFYHALTDELENRLESQANVNDWLPVEEQGDVDPLHPPTLPRGHFNTSQAKLYMDKGDRITVCGKVVGARTSRKGNVMLNLDRQYPNQVFTVFVRKEELVNFSYDPEEAWKGMYVKVTCEVANLGGKPAMFIESEKQIEAYEPAP